jgi:hypothetical protein
MERERVRNACGEMLSLIVFSAASLALRKSAAVARAGEQPLVTAGCHSDAPQAFVREFNETLTTEKKG